MTKSFAMVAIGAGLLLTGCGGSSGSCPNDLPAACPLQAPSFSAEVSGVISNRCLPCHAPGGQEAVTPLTNYDEIFNQRTAVLDQVYHCIMPLQGSAGLTAEERATLLAWLVCGSPDN
jgi:uncharacterized membrane protein